MFYGVGGNGGSCSYEACSWHEAVTTGTVDGLIGWTRTARACHMVIGQGGDVGQACDFHESVNGTAAGNGRMITVETWDGLLPATNRSPDGSFGPNDRAWNAQMAERIADIIAWMSMSKAAGGLGIPIRAMNSTRETGHAPHRLGVPSAGGAVKIPYGPDQWTAWPGKECPGDRRVEQIRGPILTRAAELAGGMLAGNWGTLPPGPVDLVAAYKRGGGFAGPDNELTGWDAIVATATQAQLDLLLKGAQAAIDVNNARDQVAGGFQNLATTNAAVADIQAKVTQIGGFGDPK